MWKELIKAILEEDFTGTLKQYKQVQVETLVMNRIRKALEFNNIDLKNLLSRYDHNDDGLIQ